MSVEDIFRGVTAGAADDVVQIQRVVVLSAITEAIREKGVDPSPTAYYGALMASLTAQRAGGESDTTVAGATYLLALLLPHLPLAVLRAQAGDAAAVLLACQKNYADSALVARQVLSCLPSLLAPQPAAAWPAIAAPPQGKAHPLCQPWQALLSGMVDARPKVRKAAQAAALRTLAESSSPAPGASAAAHCARLLHAGVGPAGRKERGKASAAIAAALGFLKSAIAQLQQQAVVGVFEPLLRVCQLGDAHAALGAIEVLRQAVDPGAAAELPASHLVTLLRSLRGMPVGTLDASCAASFSELLAAVLIGAHRAGASGIEPLVPEVWGHIQANTQSDCDIATVRASAQALLQIVECVQPAAGGGAEHMPRLVELCGELLRYKYKAWWAETMPVLSALLIQLGSSAGDEVDELLQSVATMCSSADGSGLEEEQLKVLRSVLAAAVTAIGPVRFVSIVRLDEAAVASRNAGWILSVLRSGIQRAELRFFPECALPFIELLTQQLSAALPAEEKFRVTQLESRTWGLLIPLCSTRPTDVVASFKTIAKTLGDALRKKALRTTICSSLTALIRNSRRDAASAGPSADEGQHNVAEIAKYDKNFLPILFNIFGETSGGGESDAVVGTIAAYASVADPHRLNTFFKTIMKKLLEAISGAEASESRDRHVMTDLALALAAALSQENLSLLYRCVRPQLVHSDATLQKKSYKVVLHLLGTGGDAEAGDGAGSAAAVSFADDHAVLMDIGEALAASTQACQAAARPLRHRCLQLCVGRIENDELASFAQVFLGEVILATKEPNAKAREAGLAVVSGLAARMGAIRALPQYMAMLAAGLAGKSPHMIIASVGCMAHVLGAYREAHDIEPEFASMLLGNIALLLHHTTTGVVKAALGFLKVATQAFDHDTLRKHLPELIPGLLKWIRESNETRLKIRYLLHRFIRKLGEELVFEHVPATHHKLLQNILKMHQNAKKLKKQAKKKEAGGSDDPLGRMWSDSDSDSDSDPESETDGGEASAPSARARARRGAADARASWLHESQSGSNPLDLLGTSAARHVSFQDPKALARQARRSAKLHSKFETRDGKLVVPDDSRKRTREDGEEAEERQQAEAAAMRGGDTSDSDDDGRAAPGPKRQRAPFQSGEEFKAPRAAGDVKRGGVDPYAYVPLDRRMLQKRQNKRKDAAAKYDGLVKGAQKGAKAGRRRAGRK